MTCKFPRILLLLIAALVATAFTVSCSSDDNEPTPVPSPPPPPVKVGRAVLVYMLADNDLSGNDYLSLHPRLPQQYSPQNYERGVELADGVRRLFDFGDYMDALCAGDPTLEASLARWHEALDGCVRWKAATPAIFNSLVIRKHCGLSTFIMRQPSDAGVSGYNRLKWYSDVAGTLYPSE